MTAIPDDVLVIGLGGNIGDERAIVERFVRARTALAQLGRIRSANLYRSAPVGLAQPTFLNSAVHVEYRDATPGELIATVLELEQALGRDRRGEARGGPRRIDLDVLIWGGRVLDTPELTVPHPRLFERRFALAPLSDLLGEDLLLPRAAEPIRVLLARLSGQAIERLAASW